MGRPGNANLARHYADNRGAVAFLDESYNADPARGDTFYVVSAVVAEAAQIVPLRDGLDELVPDGWWHTTDQLLTEPGRRSTRELLKYLAEGRETCVVTHRRRLEAGDRDGENGRRAALRAVFAHLWERTAAQGGQVKLAVLEERRELSQRRADMATRAEAISSGLCGAAFRLVQVSPADEHLLWLPDLACSAYRRNVVQGDPSYFDEIRAVTTVLIVP
jgi:hypothetical protein